VRAPRILVVDDEPSVGEAVGRVLAAEGYEVETASVAEEGLKRALASPPALVVLDILMPELSGWELCDILRRQSHTRDVPVLFLTAKGEIVDRITARQVGGTDYLTKPFRAEELRAKVRALVRSGPARGSERR
jgi:two-component system response regulator MprA